MPETAILTFQGLGVALALGMVVGLERGWSLRALPSGARYAGLRTFSLIGLLGGFTALLNQLEHEPFALMTFAAFILLITATAARPSPDGGNGITSFIAAIITYLAGVIAGFGHYDLAAIIAVVTTVILGMKEPLHRMIDSIERSEINAALQFLVISLVLLPVLPDRGYGPWEALNPYQIWWMVVLISAISLIGHFAAKWMAPGKGILLTGVLGGMASSTAIAVSFSRMGKDRAELLPMLAAGIIAASTTMFPRMLLIVFALDSSLAAALLLPFGLAMLAGWAAAWHLWKPHLAEPAAGERVERPATSFDLGVPLQFGFFLAVVLLASEAVRHWIGDQALYYVAVIAGLADVNAITITAARGTGSGLAFLVAMGVIVIAAISNSLSKAGIVGVIGDRAMLRAVAPGFIGMTLAMIAGYGLFAITKL